jgi:microcystin-dependent protein
MSYTKNHDPWASGDLLNTTALDNFETIYTEASSYLSSHTHDGSYYTQAEMQSTFWYAGNDGSGSGADADLLYKSTGNLHAASFAGLGVPTGLVILWYGSVASIPSGWHLCDGTAGTIDLRGKIPVGAGAGSDYSVGDTGGSATFTASGTITVSTHALTTAEMASHRHPFQDKYGGTGGTSNSAGANAFSTSSGEYSTGTTSSAGSGSAHGHSAAEGTSFNGSAVASLPFCMALCYIQKISEE